MTAVLIEPAKMPWLWELIWSKLEELEGDYECEHQEDTGAESHSARRDVRGEVWQYLGSKIDGDQMIHTFRHCCHPKTKKREYRHLLTQVFEGGIEP